MDANNGFAHPTNVYSAFDVLKSIRSLDLSFVCPSKTPYTQKISIKDASNPKRKKKTNLVKC